MPPFDPPEPGSGEPYVIKDIELKPGQRPGIRKELREFKKDEYAWNLYLLGLWQFQLMPQGKLLSYFQIAGMDFLCRIHRLQLTVPRNSWSAIPGMARR